MKLSKKYVKRIKKRVLGCMSSIVICLMLIAGSELAGLSTPISNLIKLSQEKSSADETTVGEVAASARKHKQATKHSYKNIHL